MTQSTDSKITTMVNNAMQTLERYADEGLPDCYRTFRSSLYDLYPSLPWDHNGLIAALQMLIKHSDLNRVAGKINTKFKFNLKKEFQEALELAR